MKEAAKMKAIELEKLKIDSLESEKQREKSNYEGNIELTRSS